MILNLASIKGTSNLKRLHGNIIHTVTFKGVTIISGTKSADGSPWNAMDINFENADGTFTERIFAPSEKDGERVKMEGNKGEYTLPSGMEVLSLKMAHIGEALAPNNWDKFKVVKWDLPKDFLKMAEQFARVLKPAEGTETQLKLITTKDGNSALPYFVRIGKDDSVYISNNWLGKDLSFSTYELKSMKNTPAPKPTEMDNFEPALEKTDDLPFNLDLD